MRSPLDSPTSPPCAQSTTSSGVPRAAAEASAEGRCTSKIASTSSRDVWNCPFDEKRPWDRFTTCGRSVPSSAGLSGGSLSLPPRAATGAARVAPGASPESSSTASRLASSSAGSASAGSSRSTARSARARAASCTLRALAIWSARKASLNGRRACGASAMVRGRCSRRRRTSRTAANVCWKSMALPGQLFGDPSPRWNASASTGSPNRSCTRAITSSTASRWAPSSRSLPASKSPIISNMNGPAARVPFTLAELAGARFQSRPVHSDPSGPMVRCCAMSVHPFTCVWCFHIPMMLSRPRYCAWFGRHVWCMCTCVIRRVNGNWTSRSANSSRFS